MARILETQLRKQIAQAFKGKLLKGSLERVGSTSTNAFGDQVPGTPTSYTFEGIREDFDALYRESAGIPVTDVKFLIIGGSIQVEPKKDDRVRLQRSGVWGKWHSVRKILDIDPANASYSLQCFEVPT